jgi:hypothetical protein
MQNGFCESFNGRMRDELLNENLFFGRHHARARIADGVGDRNGQRPHSLIGYLTPAAYAACLTATCNRLRKPDQLRRSLVAHTAPNGITSAEAPPDESSGAGQRPSNWRRNDQAPEYAIPCGQAHVVATYRCLRRFRWPMWSTATSTKRSLKRQR